MSQPRPAFLDIPAKVIARRTLLAVLVAFGSYVAGAVAMVCVGLISLKWGRK